MKKNIGCQTVERPMLWPEPGGIMGFRLLLIRWRRCSRCRDCITAPALGRSDGQGVGSGAEVVRGCLRVEFGLTEPRSVNTTKHEIPGETAATPIAQYLTPERAVETMAMFGARRVLDTPPLHIGVLAAYGGALIAAGALFSVLLSAGVETPGPRRLLEGFGFSAGFFFVILSHAILFTEANVVMPVALLHFPRTLMRRAIRFWIAAWVGNFLGALASDTL